MSQLITKGLLSSKIISKGYFGKLGQVIIGRICMAITGSRPNAEITGSRPYGAVTGSSPDAEIIGGGCN